MFVDLLMSMKIKIVSLLVAVAVLALATPAFAVKAPTAEQIKCVSAAVDVRETALGDAATKYATVYAEALKAAYTARAAALKTAYATGNNVKIKNGIKAAWADFGIAVKTAGRDWKTDRQVAWTAYGKAVKACKAPAVANDTGKSTSDTISQ